MVLSRQDIIIHAHLLVQYEQFVHRMHQMTHTFPIPVQLGLRPKVGYNCDFLQVNKITPEIGGGEAIELVRVF